MINVIFYGTPEFAARSLAALFANKSLFNVCAVVTQPDRPAGRGGKLCASPVKELALTHNVKVLQPESIKRSLTEFLKDLSMLEPIDIGVVAAFGQILPQSVLDHPHSGCVNIHASLLPRWRGAAPIHRAIMAGDTETGVCLMKMEAGLDTGPVYSSIKVSIDKEDTTKSLHDKLALAGSQLLIQDLALIAHGQISPVLQDNSLATYATKITNEEAKIDWSRSANDLTCMIRALNPAPGAYTFLNGSRLKLFNAHAKLQSMGRSNTPGAVSYVDRRTLEIACGTGVISVLEAQAEGRKKLPIEEFLRGCPISSDTILG